MTKLNDDVVLTMDQFRVLDEWAGNFLLTDRAHQSTKSRYDAITDGGMEVFESHRLELGSAIDTLKSARDRMYKSLADALYYGGGNPLTHWADNVRGLSDKQVAFLTGAYATAFLTEPHEIPSVRSAWAYMGLHVVDGEAPSYTKGQSAGYDRDMKAKLIHRVGGIVCRQDNYYRREIYMRERAKKDAEPQPERWEDKDPKWSRLYMEHFEEQQNATSWPDASDAHKNAHALRVVTKEIIKDWWRALHGQRPHALGER